MTLAEILQEMRNRLNDKDAVGDFDDVELVSYINQAISYIGNYLVAMGHPLVTRTLELSDGDTLPSDFIKFCGGFYVKVEGRTATLLKNKKKPMTVKYFFELPQMAVKINASTKRVTNGTDELPIVNYTFNNAVLQMAILFAMNQQKFNIQQDQAVTTECFEIAKRAFGAAET